MQCPVTGEFSWNLVGVRMLRVGNSPDRCWEHPAEKVLPLCEIEAL